MLSPADNPTGTKGRETGGISVVRTEAIHSRVLHSRKVENQLQDSEPGHPRGGSAMAVALRRPSFENTRYMRK